MKHQTIFVGSSHEGLAEAEQVRSALSGSDEGVKARLWTDFFEPSSLTFEALEEMLVHCCAAVFVVRPDDIVHHIDDVGDSKEFRMARANVLLEFGLVAGRLGRRNVAVCRFGDAKLPSDLASLTVIDMNSRQPETGPDVEAANSMPSENVLDKLKRWAQKLMATAEGIPRTSVFHGYTGPWEFELTLSRWRGMEIQDPSYAIVNGSLGLFICENGLSGTGHCYGTLAFRLELPQLEGAEKIEPFGGDVQLSHDIRNIDCLENGNIEFTSHMIDFHRVRKFGAAPSEFSFEDPVIEPWTFRWKLAPTGRPRELAGTVDTRGSGGIRGKVTAKLHHSTY